ncbi:MAG: lysine biosynthesis protein LysW [Candidatus Aenigmatarchaeota archaeon]
MESKIVYNGECAECLGEITYNGDPIVGEVITCPECGSDLEITEISSNPPYTLKLKKIQLSGEDWGE